MTGITQKGQKVLFSLWSPSRVSHQNYLVLPIEEGVVIKTAIIDIIAIIVIMIKIILVTTVTIVT